MEKKSESEKGLNQVLAFGALFLVAFALVIGFVIGQVVPQIAPSENKTQSVRIESLKSENTVLRKALSERLISHCDTATVEQKLAQQKFDDYSYQMYEIKEAQEVKVYKQNQDKEVAAYVAMDHKKVQVIFTEYWESNWQALSEMEKTDSKIFNEYAITMFKRDNLGYSDYKTSDYLSEKLKNLEKNPVVAVYLIKKNAADKVQAQKDSENEKNYQSKLAEIKKNYQAQLATIELNYNKKISAKKTELGL